MNTKPALLKLSILVILSTSCLPAPAATPTPTLDLGPQETDAAIANQTQSAQNTLNAKSTQLANETATAVMQTTQRILDMAATQTEQQNRYHATSTENAVIGQTATVAAVLQSTAQAQGMLNLIQKVSNETILTNPSGTYYRLEDFEKDLAKINHIDTPYMSGFSGDNFAIRTDIAWDSASDIANWDRAGCGFMFGAHADYFDFIYLSLDGYVHFLRPQPGKNWIYPFAIQRYRGEISKPKGEAEIMLVSINKRVSFYINGEKVLDEYEGLMKSGDLYYAMVSGTNKGFGTYCKWSNVDLWIFE
jgi:hypothetical protein